MAYLMSHERVLLARYVEQCASDRASTLAQAIADPKTSGPLLLAYRIIETVL